ncbi:MAG: CapA family protein [Chloroflexi bacterium]|nr:CapA family protein [Chloroflexota bacterium]
MTAANDTMVIHAVGDISPRRADYGEDPDSLFAAVHQKVKEADIVFGQLEKNFSNRGGFQFRDHTNWYSRVRPENVRSLVHGGFNVVSHASNHCFDYGPDSLVDTIDVVRANNIQIIGVGRDIAEARRPAIFDRKGVRVGILAYNSVLPTEYEAREQKPGCAPLRVSTYYEPVEYQAGTPPEVVTVPMEQDVLAMEEDVRNLRKQVDVVVVSMHWGIHFIPGMLADYQPEVGHRAIDAGADLILGHHAHILKGIEVYKGKVIFYSIGSFGSEGPRHKPPPGVFTKRSSDVYRKWREEPGNEHPGAKDKHYSMVARCLINKSGIEKVSFLPVWTNERSEPEFLPATDPRSGEVFQYMDYWCRKLGATLTREGDEVVVNVRQ